MASELDVNLSPDQERDFRELLKERGFVSINEFIIDALTTDRADKRRAKLESISQRMWPNGSPAQRDRS